jgi:hypothetical protein
MPDLELVCPSSSARFLRRSLTRSLSRQATIGSLSDQVLLKIFRYYLDASPRFWPRLLHICPRWRRIVFVSSRALPIRLVCTHGSPIPKALSLWPALLPIDVKYGGFQELDPTPEDEDNIMAALRQFYPVRSISLTITSSLLEKLYSIKHTFPRLENLILLSRHYVRQTLPIAFRHTSHLHCLHLTGFTAPNLLQLLLSSRNLVDLQLHDVLDPRHVSLEAFTNALSEMAQLRSLSLHFLSTDVYLASHSSTVGNVLLPVISRFNFRGSSAFLEDLVAIIDAPRLEDIEVTYFPEPELWPQSHRLPCTFNNLVDFIKRIEMHDSHRRADILSSENAISVSLTQPGASTRLKLQLLCKPLHDQLTFITRICKYFSGFKVEDLRINSTQLSSEESRCSWVGFIGPFKSVKWFHVAGHMMELVQDLPMIDERSGARSDGPKEGFRRSRLPALQKLYVQQPGPRHAPLSVPIVSFMISRWQSGHPIAVEYEQPYHMSESLRAGTWYSQCQNHYLLTRVKGDLSLSR